MDPVGVDQRIVREIVGREDVRVEVVDGRDVPVHHVREDVGGVRARHQEQRHLKHDLEHHDDRHRAADSGDAEVDQHHRGQIADARDDKRQDQGVDDDVAGDRALEVRHLEPRRQDVGQEQQLLQLFPDDRLRFEVRVREVVAVGQAVAQRPDHDPAQLQDDPRAGQQEQPHEHTGQGAPLAAGLKRPSRAGGDHGDDRPHPTLRIRSATICAPSIRCSVQGAGDASSASRCGPSRPASTSSRGT